MADYKEIRNKLDLLKAKIYDFQSRKKIADLPSKTTAPGAVRIGDEIRPTVEPKHQDVKESREALGLPMIQPRKFSDVDSIAESKKEKTNAKKPTIVPNRSPEEKKKAHFAAAMHHATWWAGHQGMHDYIGDASSHDMGAIQSDHEESWPEHEFDEDEYLRGLQEETGHLPKADEHLKLFHQHMKAAGAKKKDGLLHHSEMENLGNREQELVDAASDAKPGKEYSHIGGAHISHFGPEGVHGVPHDKSYAHIASYSHESFGDKHPMDKELPQPQAKKKTMKKSEFVPGMTLADMQKHDILTKGDIIMFPGKGIAKPGAGKFKVGDHVVHRSHGPGVIAAIEEREIAPGKKQTFHKIHIIDNGAPKAVFVPHENMDERVRPMAGKEEGEKIHAFLKQPHKVDADSQTWNRRYRGYMEQVGSGDLHQIASVYKDLKSLSDQKDLSFGEKKLKDQARNLLHTELKHATGRGMEEHEGMEKSAWVPGLSLNDQDKLEKSSKHIGFKGLEHKLEGEGYSKESADKIAGKVNAKYVHHYAHKSDEKKKDLEKEMKSGMCLNDLKKD